MIDSSKEYQLVLYDLTRRLKEEKNPQRIESLKEAIEEVYKHLNSIRKKNLEKINYCQKKSKESSDQPKEFREENDYESIYKFLNSKMFSNFDFSYFFIFYINKSKLKTIACDFVKNSKFKLAKSFQKTNIMELCYGRMQCGTTIYVKELDESYVFISKKDILTKASTLMHELGHVKVFDIKKKRNTESYFEEVYPKFLELVFSDYLTECGFKSHGYNIKISLLKEIQNHMFNMEYYKNNGFMRLTKSNYSAIKDNILALVIYMMYKEKPNDTLKKIDIFIEGLGKKSEEQLLSVFGLDLSIFTNINVSNSFREILNSQREEIKKGRIKN